MIEATEGNSINRCIDLGLGVIPTQSAWAGPYGVPHEMREGAREIRHGGKLCGETS